MILKWGNINLRKNSQGNKCYDSTEEGWEVIPQYRKPRKTKHATNV